VELKLDVPVDGGTVRGTDHVAVRGTVTPADAAVRVAGQSANVDSGAFSADVGLTPGANVIDITATAPGRRPATDALRVQRDIRVAMPNVVGSDLDAALVQVRTRGLTPAEKRGGSWLDRLFGGAVKVCATQPPAGSLVAPRSRVTIETKREC
jgi:hypothetical protein